MGFLRYWTVSNIPLFVLAFPMLAVMMISSFWVVQARNSSNMPLGLFKPTMGLIEKNERHLLTSLAAPQLVLAMLTLTSYHVQIITRISSGYCIWYFWLAHAVTVSRDESSQPKIGKWITWKLGWPEGMVMYIVVYAAVQAVLFSSFLPPA